MRTDGTIAFNKRRQFISTSLAGELVGLHDVDDCYVRVVYADAVLDPSTHATTTQDRGTALSSETRPRRPPSDESVRRWFQVRTSAMFRRPRRNPS